MSVTITILAGSLLAYLLYGVVYRLFFAPAAGIPGPKLAALTLWYEFYYDVVKGGRYEFEIAKMHAKYGLPPLSLMFDVFRFRVNLTVQALLSELIRMRSISRIRIFTTPSTRMPDKLAASMISGPSLSK